MSEFVYIFQESIPHYRIPFFNKLSEEVNIEVIHMGKFVADANFSQRIVGQFKLFKFLYFRSVMFNHLYYTAGSVVFPSDLRFLNLWFIFLIRFMCGKKNITWGHRYTKNTFANTIRNFILKMSSTVILYGEEDLDKVFEITKLKEKVFVAFNTLSVPNHQDTSLNQKRYIIFVGRLQYRKKIDLALVEFFRVSSLLPSDVSFLIVGDNVDNIDLNNLVDSHFLKTRVVFTGNVTDPAVLKNYFSESYCYLSPGDVGLGVLHSLAYGVPVITLKNQYHGPEFYNLAHNINSVICLEPSDIGDALVKICNDRLFRLRLSQSAYFLFSQERNMENMVYSFTKALNS